MKKILILFLGLILIVTSCKEDPVEKKYSIVGTWKPVKMVETTVEVVNQPISDTYYYTPCQMESRWTFNEDKSGKVLLRTDINNSCYTLKDENITYSYTEKTGDFNVKYVTFEDNGKVLDLTQNSMNLKLEKTENGVYKSKTYTMVRVQ